VVWIQYQKNVGSTDVFSRCCEIQGFFQPPVLSQWAGVQGLGGHSQAATQAGQRKCSVPQTVCSVYEWGLAGGQGSSLFQEFQLLSPFCEFALFREFREICKIHKFCDRCCRTDCKLVTGR